MPMELQDRLRTRAQAGVASFKSDPLQGCCYECTLRRCALKVVDCVVSMCRAVLHLSADSYYLGRLAQCGLQNMLPTGSVAMH